MNVGWFAFALIALAAQPSAVAAAATPDVQLRPAETLDAGRIGRASSDERAVLRVEWRAAQTGADETHAVGEMLDSLRRMEGTVAELGRLIRSVPARPAVAASVVPNEAEGLDARGSLMTGAAGAAAVLLTLLWWNRRRRPATPPAAEPGAASASNPAVESRTDAALVGLLQAAATEAKQTPAPLSVVDKPAAPPVTPAAAEPAPAPSDEKPLYQDFTATVIIKPQASPTAAAAPETEATTAAAAAATPHDDASAAPPAAVSPLIEFSLEDEDPEAIARANARIPVPRTRSGPPHVPERRKDKNVEPTLELAEIMMSMGLQQSAAQALLEYSENNPRQALYHWLKLLDIYRNAGHQDDFKETAEKLRQHFNIHADDWGRESSGDEPALESFSRVSQHVQNIWSRADECIAYLQHLLEDNREGSRTGFPRPVAEEIMLLIEILKETSGANQAAAE